MKTEGRCISFDSLEALKKNVSPINIQPPGEPREHHLGKVLQERSKSKFNIILFYNSVFWGVQVSIIQTILKSKKILFLKFFDDPNISIVNFKTSWSSYSFCSSCFWSLCFLLLLNVILISGFRNYWPQKLLYLYFPLELYKRNSK